MKLDEGIDESGNVSEDIKMKKNMSQCLKEGVEKELTSVCEEVLVRSLKYIYIFIYIFIYIYIYIYIYLCPRVLGNVNIF